MFEQGCVFHNFSYVILQLDELAYLESSCTSLSSPHHPLGDESIYGIQGFPSPRWQDRG